MNVRELLDKGNECMDLRVAIMNNCLAIKDREDDIELAKKIANYLDTQYDYQCFLYDFDMYCASVLEEIKEE